jgi:ribosome biogenesis GTPase
MGPKYRGDEEDWLDNEELASAKNTGAPSSKAKRGHQARSTHLPFEEANATVAEVFLNLCRVKLDEDRTDLLCNYRRAEVVSKAKAEVRERSPVAVGDRVLVLRTHSRGDGNPREKVSAAPSGVIEGVCSRKNRISRPAPGRDGTQVQHVLAANIDWVIVVASADQPKFAPTFIDRFLVATGAENIQTALCITKTDLLSSPAREWELYRKLGYPVFEVSSVLNTGFQAIGKLVTGKTAVFCGQSGVGKTSLLRKLLGTDVGKVGSVNESTGKGKHTTTGAVLLGGPEESNWIDTPGVKEFGLVNVTEKTLANYFPELMNIKCVQAHCSHQEEEGCKARNLPRYSSFRKIMESLKNQD